MLVWQRTMVQKSVAEERQGGEWGRASQRERIAKREELIFQYLRCASVALALSLSIKSQPK
jgi:hypothetical protein